MVHVAVNMTLKKIIILEYAFGEGGGGHQKAYAVYAFINVDNCERPLNDHTNNSKTMNTICVRQADLVNNNDGAPT